MSYLRYLFLFAHSRVQLLNTQWKLIRMSNRNHSVKYGLYRYIKIHLTLYSGSSKLQTWTFGIWAVLNFYFTSHAIWLCACPVSCCNHCSIFPFPIMPLWVFCVVYFTLLVIALCRVYPMLPMPLDCPFWIATSVFSNVYLYTIRVYGCCLYHDFFSMYTVDQHLRFSPYTVQGEAFWFDCVEFRTVWGMGFSGKYWRDFKCYLVIMHN
jgi:hypothetical protein